MPAPEADAAGAVRGAAEAPTDWAPAEGGGALGAPAEGGGALAALPPAAAECDHPSTDGSQSTGSRLRAAPRSSPATSEPSLGSGRRSGEAASLVKARYQEFMAWQILASNLVPLIYLVSRAAQGGQLVALVPCALAVLCLAVSSCLSLAFLYSRGCDTSKDALLTALVRLEYAQMSVLSLALLSEAVTRPSSRLGAVPSAMASATLFFGSAHLTIVLKWVVSQMPVRFMVLPEAARNAAVAVATLAVAHARQPEGVTWPLLLGVLARGVIVTLAAPLLCAVCHGRTFAPTHLPSALSRSDGRAAGRAADSLTRFCVRAASAMLPECIMSATAIAGVSMGVLFSILVNGGFGLGFCDLCRRINAVVGCSLLITGAAKMQAGTSTGLGMLERRLGRSTVSDVGLEARLAEAGSERDVLRCASEAAHALFPQARAQVLVSLLDDRSLRPACIEAAALEERERGALHAAVASADARSSCAFVCGAGGAPVADSRDWSAGCAEFSDWRAAVASGVAAQQLVTARFTAGANVAGYVLLAFTPVQGFASNDPATHDALRALCDCTGAALLRRRAADASAAAAARLAHVERLAGDIFPAHLLERVASRMCEDAPPPLVERHECVSVVFADVVGWTQRAAGMSPEEAMRLLDRLWQRFDTLCSSHGTYKVETVGDMYLAVCGMHPPRRDHAQAALRFALDLHAAAAGVADAGEEGVSIRVGVHSGPVSSGIVGHLRQRWCIFGDTVNTASRMESSGRPGNVQLSDTTLALAGLDAATVPSRHVDIKGKGAMTTYVLEAGSPEAQAARAVLDAAPASAEDTLHADLPERESLDGSSCDEESDVDDAPLPIFPPSGLPAAGGSPSGPGSLSSSNAGMKSRDSVSEADAVASSQAHAHAVVALLLGACGPLGFCIIWLLYLSGGNRLYIAAGRLLGASFAAAIPLLITAYHTPLPIALSRTTVLRLCLAACIGGYVFGHALALQTWCTLVRPGPGCELAFYWDAHAFLGATMYPLTTMLPIHLHLAAEVARFVAVVAMAAALQCSQVPKLALHGLVSVLLTPLVIVCSVDVPGGLYDAYTAAVETCPAPLRPLRDRAAAFYLATRVRLLGANAPPLLGHTGLAVFGLRIATVIHGLLSASVDGAALEGAGRELNATLVLVMCASALSRVSLRTAGSSAAADTARQQQRLAGILRDLREQLAGARSEAASLAAGCAALTAILPGASAVAVGAFAQGTSGVMSCVELTANDALARTALAAALPADVGGTAGTSVHRACHSAGTRGAASAVLDSREYDSGLAECADWASAAAGGLEASRALTVPLTAGPVVVGFATVYLSLFHADDGSAGALHAVLREAAGVLGGALFVRRAFAINRDGDVRPAPAAGMRRRGSKLDLSSAADDGAPAYPSSDADVAALALLDARRAADCALLDSWSLDATALPEDELPRLLAAMLHSLGLFRRFQLSPTAFADFVADTATHYSANPFHHFQHAFMVAHQCWLFLRDDATRALLQEIDQLTLLLAAICHDVEHPGTTNAFQVNSGSMLALRYNDVSVLEAHHSSVGSSILQRSRVLASLGPEDLRCLRRTFVAAVLATDMSVHKQLLAKVRAVLDDAGADDAADAGSTARRMSMAAPAAASGFASGQPEERQLLVSFLLHCADLGNPLRPPSLSARIADDLQREFEAQAARERAQGLPVTVMLASTDEAKAKLELGFLEFVVAPLFVTLASVVPRLGNKCVKLIDQNRAAWQARIGAA